MGKLDNIRAHQFKKGQSGNPGGRPKGFSLLKMMREFYAADDPKERKNRGLVLLEATYAKGKKGDLRVLIEALDRLHGKPLARIEVEGAESKMPGVDDAALVKKLQARGQQGPDGGPVDG